MGTTNTHISIYKVLAIIVLSACIGITILTWTFIVSWLLAGYLGGWSTGRAVLSAGPYILVAGVAAACGLVLLSVSKKVRVWVGCLSAFVVSGILLFGILLPPYFIEEWIFLLNHATAHTTTPPLHPTALMSALEREYSVLGMPQPTSIVYTDYPICPVQEPLAGSEHCYRDIDTFYENLSLAQAEAIVVKHGWKIVKYDGPDGEIGNSYTKTTPHDGLLILSLYETSDSSSTSDNGTGMSLSPVSEE